MIKFYKELNYKAVSDKGAELIIDIMKNTKAPVLGLATGSSPIGIYGRLIKAYENNIIDFSNTKSINLDEYQGISPDNNQSYAYFMNEHLFNKVNIKKENIHIPEGLNLDAEKACSNYDKIIENLETDIQILGIGENGHIGFNEPCDYFIKNTHLVSLSQSTILANSRFFEKEADVPKKAYTMGIYGIMKAKQILLIACGKNKSEAIKKAFTGNITPMVPASILQLHNNVTVIVDEAAGIYI